MIDRLIFKRIGIGSILKNRVSSQPYSKPNIIYIKELRAQFCADFPANLIEVVDKEEGVNVDKKEEVEEKFETKFKVEAKFEIREEDKIKAEVDLKVVPKFVVKVTVDTEFELLAEI
jgi:hypothetical protein